MIPTMAKAATPGQMIQASDTFMPALIQVLLARINAIFDSCSRFQIPILHPLQSEAPDNVLEILAFDTLS